LTGQSDLPAACRQLGAGQRHFAILRLIQRENGEKVVSDTEVTSFLKHLIDALTDSRYR